MRFYPILPVCFTFLLLSALPGPAQTSILVTVSRSLDRDVVYSGGSVVVRLDCSLLGDVTGLVVIERFPAGFRFTGSTSNPAANGAKLNETASELKWVFINLETGANIEINYTVDVPVVAQEGSFQFEGEWKAVTYEGEGYGYSPTTQIRVQKSPCTISLDVTPSKAKVGEGLTVSGSTSPARHNVTVVLNYTRPDNSTFQRSVSTSVDGFFRDSFFADVEGSWNVVASWSGDEETRSAVSLNILFTVEKSNSFEVWVPIVVTLSLVLVIAVIIILILIRKQILVKHDGRE